MQMNLKVLKFHKLRMTAKKKKKLPSSTKSKYKHKTTNKITQVPSSVLLPSGSTYAVLKIIAVSKKKKKKCCDRKHVKILRERAN